MVTGLVSFSAVSSAVFSGGVTPLCRFVGVCEYELPVYACEDGVHLGFSFVLECWEEIDRTQDPWQLV